MSRSNSKRLPRPVDRIAPACVVVAGACIGTALAIAGLASPASAQQNCRILPSTETGPLLVGAFGRRMAQMGAPIWLLHSTEAGRGDLYFSRTTEVRLFVKESGGLAQEVTVMAGDPGDADLVRLQVGANFVAARLSGRPEEATRSEVFGLVEQVRVRRKLTGKKIGDVLVIVQPGDERGVLVTVGRHACS